MQLQPPVVAAWVLRFDPYDKFQLSLRTEQERNVETVVISDYDLCTGPGSKSFLGSFETQFKRIQLKICVSINFFSLKFHYLSNRDRYLETVFIFHISWKLFPFDVD